MSMNDMITVSHALLQRQIFALQNLVRVRLLFRGGTRGTLAICFACTTSYLSGSTVSILVRTLPLDIYQASEAYQLMR